MRKQARQEKKTQQLPSQKRGRQQYGGGAQVVEGGEENGDEDEVDPFDISELSDIQELMKPVKERKKKAGPEKERKSKSSKSKKPEPELEPKKEKMEKAKTAKRLAIEDLDDESAPQKKKPNKAVLDRIAQDEAEIAFLEKKLKIKSKKVPKAFEEDGLDFLLDGLKEDYLGDLGEPAKKKGKAKTKVEVPVDEEDDVSDDEDEEIDDMSGDGSEGDDNDLGSGEDDFEGFSDGDSSEAEEAPPPPPKVRENPYKPGVTASAETDEKPAAKYIPPSLRKPASSESERLTRLQRQVQGLINRLSEAKLIPILGDFEELYRSNPRADVTSILTNILVATLCDPSALNDTYHVLHGGFLAGLYKIMGTNVGATVVQRIVEEFLSQHNKANGIVDGPSTAGKECTNLISFLSELYNFQVIGCVLIFDFIRVFLSELTELHTELLLKVVRNTGPQLRSDDPTALKSLVVLLQPAIAKAGGTEKLSVRTKFMIETLTSLKNNRLKSSTATSVVTAEHTVRMKKLLGSLNTRTLRATEPLRASLDDIKYTETKGKWWLVGASWVGGAPSKLPHEEEEEQGPVAPYVPDSEGDSAGMPDLQALARQHRMNTDIRRAIFITLLSSTDFADAHTKLLKLRLKRSQEREIPRVLLHCAASEGTYNPYYTLVAKKLCSGHALRMTFTFTLWDYFRRFGEDDGSSTATNPDDDIDDNTWSQPAGLRKIVNLARLYASLITSGSLQLTILKTLNWAYLQPPTKSFLEILFTTVLAENEWGLNVVFSNVSDGVELVRGVLHFIKKTMKHGGIAAGDEEKAAVKKGCMIAVEMLEGVLKAQRGSTVKFRTQENN